MQLLLGAEDDQFRWLTSVSAKALMNRSDQFRKTPDRAITACEQAVGERVAE